MAGSIETVCDIESTGLSADYDNILEFAWIKTNPECEILGAGTLYFWKPEWKIHEDAYKVHGLTADYMEQFIDDFDKNLATLYTIVFNSIIIGKNSKSFDNRMLESFISRYMPAGLMECRIMGWMDIQDYTTPIFREWFYKTYKKDTQRKGTLTEIATILGMTTESINSIVKQLMGGQFSREGFHTAMFDTVVTYLIAQWLVETGRANMAY